MMRIFGERRGAANAGEEQPKPPSESPVAPRPAQPEPAHEPVTYFATTAAASRPAALAVADHIREQIFARIEPAVAVKMTRNDLMLRVEPLVAQIANEQRVLLNLAEQHTFATDIVDDMIGLGPIAPMVRDDEVADILVNGPKQVYVERRGKLELTNATFRSDAHVLASRAAHRIVGGTAHRRIRAPCSMRASRTEAASMSSPRR